MSKPLTFSSPCGVLLKGVHTANSSCKACAKEMLIAEYAIELLSAAENALECITQLAAVIRKAKGEV